MDALAAAALAFCFIAVLTHLVTAAMTIQRYRRQLPDASSQEIFPTTIIRPVCGLDYFDALTLKSTFTLDHPNYEIIFCCARADDTAVPLVRALMAAFPEHRARLLIGDDKPTANPKLNNIVKGWNAAKTDWIILADSNVLMPPDYIDALMRNYTPQTGLVCSPPVGSRPIGFIAELECAFLNGYQARWQCAAATIGLGFAQGKSMLWQRDVLDKSGGIVALGAEIAEDAAATKIVRAQGLNVRLVAQPFEQPIGPRLPKSFWDRQVRWARLRRATFAGYYAPEVLTGGLPPIVAGLFAAEAYGFDVLSAFVVLCAVWYGTEAILTRAAGWHMSRVSPFAWALRDVLLPVLWLQGWSGNTFTWRGNAMTVRDDHPLTSNVQPFAQVAERRY